ncbi:MAG: hypothetical protein IIA66_10170 [Planctomycetes bacterium]|nr:hypothetical protein [Planctomycetota bacterium]
MKSQRTSAPKEPRVEWNPDGSGARAQARGAGQNDPGDLQSLPDDLRSRIDQAIADRPRRLESVRKIYDHFALKDQGITYKSFLVYARRKGWRGRLAATGRVIGAMFGSPERDEADRLCNSAYLSLMSTVSGMLQEDEEQFPTAELVRLSKIITDQRAVGVKERNVELKTAKQTDSAGGNDKAKPLDTGLPENFDEIVRRIYGVEIKDEKRSCQL